MARTLTKTDRRAYIRECTATSCGILLMNDLNRVIEAGETFRVGSPEICLRTKTCYDNCECTVLEFMCEAEINQLIITDATLALTADLAFGDDVVHPLTNKVLGRAIPHPDGEYNISNFTSATPEPVARTGDRCVCFVCL